MNANNSDSDSGIDLSNGNKSNVNKSSSGNQATSDAFEGNNSGDQATLNKRSDQATSKNRVTKKGGGQKQLTIVNNSSTYTNRKNAQTLKGWLYKDKENYFVPYPNKWIIEGKYSKV